MNSQEKVPDYGVKLKTTTTSLSIHRNIQLQLLARTVFNLASGEEANTQQLEIVNNYLDTYPNYDDFIAALKQDLHFDIAETVGGGLLFSLKVEEYRQIRHHIEVLSGDLSLSEETNNLIDSIREQHKALFYHNDYEVPDIIDLQVVFSKLSQNLENILSTSVTLLQRAGMQGINNDIQETIKEAFNHSDSFSEVLDLLSMKHIDKKYSRLLEIDFERYNEILCHLNFMTAFNEEGVDYSHQEITDFVTEVEDTFSEELLEVSTGTKSRLSLH